MGRMPFQGMLEGESAEDRDIIDRAIERIGLKELADRHINTMSGGERQRVIIARAVAQTPKIILMDEPTLHLDISMQFDALDLVHRLAKEEGLTVIIVSHDLPMVARYCDRIIMLHDHKVFCDGPPEEVLTQENMRTIFGIDAEMMKDPKTGMNTVMLHGSARNRDRGRHLLHRVSDGGPRLACTDEEREGKVHGPAVLGHMKRILGVRHYVQCPHTHLQKGIGIPLGTPEGAQREVERYVLYDLRIHTEHVDVVLLAPHAAAFVQGLIVTVMEEEVMVGVEDHQLPSGAEHPEPFGICGRRVLQVPDQVPRYHEVEGCVREVEGECVHAPEVGVYPVPAAVGCRLREHGVRCIDAGDPVSAPSENDGEEARSGAHVEDVQPGPAVQIFIDDLQPVPVIAGIQILADLLLIPFGARIPIFPDLFQLTSRLPDSNTYLIIVCTGFYSE